MPHPACLSLDELIRECEFRRQRRSGPGGQHRNKVETAVFVTHVPTQTEAEACEKRSQAENRATALFRLRVKLAIGVRVAASVSPSTEWKNRVSGGKIPVNAGHDDFPAILSEAMDVLASHQWDIPSAAESLQITGSQLTKLLRKEPSAFMAFNREREVAGRPRLR